MTPYALCRSHCAVLTTGTFHLHVIGAADEHTYTCYLYETWDETRAISKGSLVWAGVRVVSGAAVMHAYSWQVSMTLLVAAALYIATNVLASKNALL
jgi:hypothetical protein